MSKRGKKRLCSILHTMHAGNWGGVAMRIIIPLAALPLLLSRGGGGRTFFQRSPLSPLCPDFQAGRTQAVGLGLDAQHPQEQSDKPSTSVHFSLLLLKVVPHMRPQIYTKN